MAMNFETLNGKSIEDSFWDFHRSNPHIYHLFAKYALYMIRSKGMKKISSKLIINRIRWEVYVETDTDDDYRINDAFTPWFSRLFIKDFPEYKNIFEFRRIRSMATEKNLP